MGLARKLVIVGTLLAQACSIDQPVSGPVALTSEWTTVTPPAPLKVGNREQQKFCLQVGQMHDLNFENGVALDNEPGQRHVLEGKAVDDAGTQYPLKLAEAGGDHVCLYRAGEPIAGPNFPADKTIVALRLRSEPPLQVGEIRWRSYDQK
jgi:hypothetical protein